MIFPWPDLNLCWASFTSCSLCLFPFWHLWCKMLTYVEWCFQGKSAWKRIRDQRGQQSGVVFLQHIKKWLGSCREFRWTESSAENDDGRSWLLGEGVTLAGGLHLLTSLQSSVLTVVQIFFLKCQSYHSAIKILKFSLMHWLQDRGQAPLYGTRGSSWTQPVPVLASVASGSFPPSSYTVLQLCSSWVHLPCTYFCPCSFFFLECLSPPFFHSQFLVIL